MSTCRDGKEGCLEEKRRRDEEYVVHLVLWARQDEECQELRTVIKCVSERQQELSGYDGKKGLLSEAREDLRKQILHEIRERDEIISAEEVERLEDKQNLEEMMKERRNAEVEGERERRLLLKVMSLE